MWTKVEKLARDIFAREASFTTSKQAHFLLFMRMSALGRERTCLHSAKSGHSALESLTESIS